MHFQYCPHCGAKLVERPTGDEGLVPWCERCNTPLFDMFPTCVIVLVADEAGEVALLQQGHLSNTFRTLVSGYIKPGEDAETTALREVQEEIGLTLDRLDFAGTYWFGRRDMLMVGYIGYARRAELRLSVEVEKAQWVPAAQALELVHPGRSISRILVEKYLAAQAGAVQESTV